MLRWLLSIVDEAHLYDDRSEDDTADLARTIGCWVTVRPEDRPTFFENEAQFRGDAWSALQRSLNPVLGDWVLTIDADEFLVADPGRDERRVLEHEIGLALERRRDCIEFPKPEGFGFEDGRLMIRTDGYWPLITETRLVRWTDRLTFARNRRGVDIFQALSGGSVPPSYRSPDFAGGLYLLHLGYVRTEDRKKKFDAYSGVPGHSRKHVASIMRSPNLEPWNGKTPVEVERALASVR